MEPNENFCSNCGAKVIRDEPPQPTYTPPKSTHESTSKPAAENKTVNFLALLGILLFIGVAFYFANHRQSDEALGELYIGMSKDEADSNFGAGNFDITHGDKAYSYADGNYLLQFDFNDKADFIDCSNETVNTKKGIHIGSTIGEIKRAYGNDYEFDGTTFKETPAYIYTLGNSQLFFFVDKATNRVNGIRVDTFRR